MTSIGDYAFNGCKTLTSLKLPKGITQIGKSAFSSCSGISGELVIPDSVTSIGDYAFGICNSLQSVIIPDKVTSIGMQVFAYCRSLQSITIPNSVTEIGESAFAYCDKITDVYYSGTEEQWKQIGIQSNNDPLLNATIHFAESILGDVTGDGEVNVMDLIRLKKCIADGSAAEMQNMDINGDGVVNVLDLIRLKKIIAGA